jgi:hypothetical protein
MELGFSQCPSVFKIGVIVLRGVAAISMVSLIMK